MIPVTKPFFPPKEEVFVMLEDIWQRQWLTNNGPLVNELELKLKDYLDLPHMLYTCNGTMALQIAIKALRLKGEIITTPFSYVATTSSILWEGCKPIFVDIDARTLNINAELIEKAITPSTTGILATHVFGNPCNIDRIEQIARKHSLKVIYDAAHAFGSKYKGKSVFNYGDISTTSFHATKLYHTVEGGAVFCKDPEMLKKMAFLRNFGHSGPHTFDEIGINGKNSELHAAMGLVNLRYINEILEKRKELSLYYNSWFANSNLSYQQVQKDGLTNFSYYPLIFENEDVVLDVINELEGNLISPRRYFYPSLNTISIFNPAECPVSDSISRRVLCLPLYFTLTKSDIDFICRVILRKLNN